MTNKITRAGHLPSNAPSTRSPKCISQYIVYNALNQTPTASYNKTKKVIRYAKPSSLLVTCIELIR